MSPALTGISISEAINQHRLDRFLVEEIKKLNLDSKKEIFIYPVVRYDNFFFQKRFVFVIIGDLMYIKKALDTKSNWKSLPLKSLAAKITPVRTINKFAIENCGDMLYLNSPLYPEVFKGGRSFLVEEAMGTTIAIYSEDGNKSLFSHFKLNKEI